ncbi:MAG: PAS domain-containing protein [Geobacteraceae bacterium]|nr:PAS domain-containing protein [Geobacteraceae bacterium]
MIHEPIWEKLWEFDPNCLVVFDQESLIVQLVNPSFCQIVKSEKSQVLEKHASAFFDDLSVFREAWDDNTIIRKEKKMARFGVYVRLIIFPMKDEGFIACIMVDLTSEYAHLEELRRMKHELLLNVNKVIDKQMHIAQEIASLLGETTAEAKVSLIQIRNVLNQEIQ